MSDSNTKQMDNPRLLPPGWRWARLRDVCEMAGVEGTRIDTEHNLLDVLDKVHEMNAATVSPKHVFIHAQVYEALLLKIGEKDNAIYPTALINLVLHDIDESHLWHGDTL